MKDAREEKPPILGTWANIYLLLTAVLIALGLFFYLFTKHFE
jgi:hypothetical protein